MVHKHEMMYSAILDHHKVQYTVHKCGFIITAYSNRTHAEQLYTVHAHFVRTSFMACIHSDLVLWSEALISNARPFMPQVTTNRYNLPFSSGRLITSVALLSTIPPCGQMICFACICAHTKNTTHAHKHKFTVCNTPVRT